MTSEVAREFTEERQFVRTGIPKHGGHFVRAEQFVGDLVHGFHEGRPPSAWSYITIALTCDGAFLLRARRRQVQRVVRQRALSLGGPPWPCKTVAAQPVLHRQV